MVGNPAKIMEDETYVNGKLIYTWAIFDSYVELLERVKIENKLAGSVQRWKIP